MFDEGRLNDIQKKFWQTKPVEELYDLQNDRWETNNLAANGKHPALEKFRIAEQQQAERIRDLGFIPEAERLRMANGKSPRDAAQSDQDYPFTEVFKLARQASDFNNMDTKPFVQALGHSHPVMRYWGVMGLEIRTDVSEHDTLVKLLTDESPSVRIAAAEALATYGTPADLPRAFDVLATHADGTKNGFVAVEALQALRRLGPKAALVKARLAALPKKTEGVEPRLKEYLPRLLEKILQDLGD
jgi:uncharacterized sulfatase